MSFVICRTEKYSKKDIKKVGNHHGRTKEAYASNPDIAPSRTHLNINTGNIANLKNAVMQQINTRCPMKDGKKRRKDAVLCYEVLLSASPEWWPANWQEMSQAEFRMTQGFTYLTEALDKVVKKFGQENYIGAALHLDEKTPHLSAMFVPIIGDKLCAKEVLTKPVLIELQNEVAEVGKKFGLERGIHRDDGERRKHLDTAEFKAQADIKRIREQLQAMIRELKVIAEDIEVQKADLATERARLQAQIAQIADGLDEKQMEQVKEFIDTLLAAQKLEIAPGR